MDPASIIAFAKSAQSISDFVCGSGLREAVSTIVGDIHVDAAKLALETAKIAVNPKDRLNSVITHLEAAHASYASIHNQAGSFAKKLTDWQLILNAVIKDVWVCSVMALCYASLGERMAVTNSLTLAERAFESKKKESEISEGAALLGIPMLLLGLLNPRNWTIQDELMDEQEFTEFKAAIQRATA